MMRGGRLAEEAPIQSDRELLRAIRDDLWDVYEVILQRPPPHNVRAVLSRLDHEWQLGEVKGRSCRLGRRIT
jgi:hypothetical protein